jgi:hypothetical protein
MRCACGTEPDVDSFTLTDGTRTTAIGNGSICECDRFTCSACIARAEAADPDYDPTLCFICDAAYARAAAIFAEK